MGGGDLPLGVADHGRGLDPAVRARAWPGRPSPRRGPAGRCRGARARLPLGVLQDLAPGTNPRTARAPASHSSMCAAKTGEDSSSSSAIPTGSPGRGRGRRGAAGAERGPERGPRRFAARGQGLEGAEQLLALCAQARPRAARRRRGWWPGSRRRRWGRAPGLLAGGRRGAPASLAQGGLGLGRERQRDRAGEGAWAGAAGLALSPRARPPPAGDAPAPPPRSGGRWCR